MPTLSENQVGIGDENRVTKDVSPLVACPYCDKLMSPRGNIGTRTLMHPSKKQIVFYRTHRSCAEEALPTEIFELDAQALAFLEADNVQTRARGMLQKH